DFRRTAVGPRAQENMPVKAADAQLEGDRPTLFRRVTHARFLCHAGRAARRTRRAISANTRTLDVNTRIAIQSCHDSGSTPKTGPPNVTIRYCPMATVLAIARNA